MGLQHDEVLRASAAWTSVWFPAHAGHADLGWLEYYLVDGVGTVMQVRPGAMTTQELVPRVIAELRDTAGSSKCSGSSALSICLLA